MTNEDQKEIPKYISRAVSDIARKCRCQDYTIWLAMKMLSSDYIDKHRLV